MKNMPPWAYEGAINVLDMPVTWHYSHPPFFVIQTMLNYEHQETFFTPLLKDVSNSIMEIVPC